MSETTTKYDDKVINDLSECSPQFSTEVLLYIFSFLKPKSLTKCREVCTRWKIIVDSLLRSEDLWRKHCKNDFPDIYKTAYYKRKPDLSWCNLYRSLSLWPKLQYATEVNDELAAVSHSGDIIRGFQILSQGRIGVHTVKGIVHCYLKTLKQNDTDYTIPGYYLRYFENEEFVIINGFGSHLHITRKTLKCRQVLGTLHSVKNFLLVDGVLYFLTLLNEVYICDLKNEEIKCSFIVEISDSVMCLGYKNGDLHVLTYRGDIGTIVGKEFVFQCTINDEPNLLHLLDQYNFLENLDWRAYYQWMFKLRRNVPQDLIIVYKVYGDVVFVGSYCGIFRIYHSPYIDNKLDLFNTKPVKEYNFMQDSSGPGAVPILDIDVIEGVDGHTVLVAMPQKIAVIHYSHNMVNNVSQYNFDEAQSFGIVP